MSCLSSIQTTQSRVEVRRCRWVPGTSSVGVGWDAWWPQVSEGGVYWHFLRFGNFYAWDLLFKLHCEAVICAKCLKHRKSPSWLEGEEEQSYNSCHSSGLIANQNCFSKYFKFILYLCIILYVWYLWNITNKCEGPAWFPPCGCHRLS